MSKQARRQSGGPIHSFLHDTDVSHLSTALVIATIEFVGCTGVLLALSALGTISSDAAILWSVMILLPLSLTIGYLGVGVGMVGRRAAIRSAVHDSAVRDGLTRIARS